MSVFDERTRSGEVDGGGDVGMSVEADNKDFSETGGAFEAVSNGDRVETCM